MDYVAIAAPKNNNKTATNDNGTIAAGQLWTFLIPVWVSIKNSRMVLSEHYYKKHDYALWNADGGKTSTYCCACCDQQELHVQTAIFTAIKPPAHCHWQANGTQSDEQQCRCLAHCEGFVVRVLSSSAELSILGERQAGEGLHPRIRSSPGLAASPGWPPSP